MTLVVELVRPDDLLSLRVEAVNMRLDAADPASPLLVVEDAAQPAYLVVHFPPQAVAEGAYFRTLPRPIVLAGEPPQRNPPPDNAPSALPDTALPPPGQPTPARISGPSRLVFVVPPDAAIPYSVAGLLDWSTLTPALSPLVDPGAPDAGPTPRSPDPLETALELPYRLQISPPPGAVWLHRATPHTRAGRTELWHTRLMLRDADGALRPPSRLDPAPLRAIWSPDYNPDSPPGFQTPDPDLGLVTALSPKDRHELVVLTAAYRGYVDERNQTYRPQPFFAEQLMLSALGGYLTSRGGWDPPWRWIVGIIRPLFERIGGVRDAVEGADALREQVAPGVDRLRDELLRPQQRDPLVPLQRIGRRGRRLDVSEWIHVATQGRDHYVRVVYEGNLYPFGHRAALVKVTERRFIDRPGGPVAYLIQRMYIVVRQPEVSYVGRLPNVGRGLPLTRVRLTTLVTPDIAFPFDKPSNITGGSFWVMTGAPGQERDFPFHAVGADIGEGAVELITPLIFVPFSDQPASFASVFSAYAASGERRLARVPGQKLRLAEPEPNAEESTTFNAVGLRFGSESDALPGFWQPRLHTADVRVPAIQQLLGQEQPTTLALLSQYVSGGAEATNGLFALVADAGGAPRTLGVGFEARQAGGIATPNMAVRALSRRIGPVAGSLADALGDRFDPVQFFPPGSAALFGTFNLAALLAPLADLAGGAPAITARREGDAMVADLRWSPAIRDEKLTVGIATFSKRGDTRLTVIGRIVRPLPGSGVPEEARFEGELTSFIVDLLNVVAINFDAFGFTTVTGRKPDVRVRLDPARPIVFQGDLSFVEELRKLIPPGLFGDGPSLDLTPELVRAGFSLGLPPVAVGVFALKDVSLGAFLELPFASGRPTFDFAVSERHRPFVLTVLFLGGGGFFHLQIDTLGVKQLEAALEFGATASLNLGVASGSVHMMAGIYFGMARDDQTNVLQATLSGYLRVGGELSVLGFISISVEFNLSFRYLPPPKAKAYGKATLTVTVEIAFFSKSVELTVEKSFGGSSGDPTFGDALPDPALWAEYAAAFA